MTEITQQWLSENAQLLWALGVTGNIRERAIRRFEIDLAACEAQRCECDRATKVAASKAYGETET
jgi:hypothetical protein